MTYSLNEKGHRMNRQGTTDYWSVVRNPDTGLYWAFAPIAEDEYEVTGSRTVLRTAVLFELGVFTNVEDAAEAVKNFHEDREHNIQELKYYGRAAKVGEGWAYDVRCGDQVSTGARAPNKGKVKVSINIGDQELTEDTVARQVNTLLGPTVKVQARVTVRNIVVANLEFYRSTSDVTAYVQDLVNYIVR